VTTTNVLGSEDPALDPPAATSSPTITTRTTLTEAPAKAQRRSWEGKDLGPVMRAALVRHLDPGKDHLLLRQDAVPVFGQPGLRQATLQIGWRNAGQQGEGKIWLELADSERAIGDLCGGGRIGWAPGNCREVRLGNGRTAQVGERNGEYEIGYLRPDGGVVYIVASKRFHQNTEIPVGSLGITRDQLLALAQDQALALPAMTPAERAEVRGPASFNPDTGAMLAALKRHLGNGTLTKPVRSSVPEQASAWGTWQATGSTLQLAVDVSVDERTMVSSCEKQLQVSCTERLTLPDGRVVWLGEDKAKGRLGVRYQQPDGNVAFASAWTRPIGSRPKGAVTVTRQQLVALVTDPALLDRK
jgi:hypothetical protein